MRELIDFCVYVLGALVGSWFDLDLGDYSYGDFMVALLVISVFVGSLVISFRTSNSPGRAANPYRSRQSKNQKTPDQ